MYSSMSVSKILGNRGSNHYGCVLLGVHETLIHTYYVIVHVENVMGIVLLCESAPQIMALMMILQYHKTLSLISLVLYTLSDCVSDTSLYCLLCFFDNPYISRFNSQNVLFI